MAKDPLAPIVLENDNLRVLFDTVSGKLESITNKLSGVSSSVRQDWLYYSSFAATGSDEDKQNSGAYIFRPRGEETMIGNGAPALTQVGCVAFHQHQSRR